MTADVLSPCVAESSTVTVLIMQDKWLHVFRAEGFHDDVIKWKHFPRYWPFARSPVNSPHKGQWRGALMFSLIYVWINGWINNRAHYDVIVMSTICAFSASTNAGKCKHIIIFERAMSYKKSSEVLDLILNVVTSSVPWYNKITKNENHCSRPSGQSHCGV